MQVASPGTSITLSVFLNDNDGNPLVASVVSAYINNELGQTVQTGLVPSVEATGSYSLVVNVPASASPGTWSAVFTASTPAGAATGSINFAVGGANTLNLFAQALTNPAEISTYTGKPLIDNDILFLDMVIEMIQSEIEAYLHRPVTVRQFQHIETITENQSVIWLPQSPVAQISQVLVNPTSPGGGTILQPQESYMPIPGGIEFSDPTYQLAFVADSQMFFASVEGTQVQITYYAGLDGPTIPAIVAVARRAVAREFLAYKLDVQNLSSLSAGVSSSYKFTDSNAGGLTEKERISLNRYRRMVIA